MSVLREIGAILTSVAGPVTVVRVARREGLGAVGGVQVQVHTDGGVVGELLGGAVVAAAGALVAEVVADGTARRASVDLAETTAVGSGLACGGRVVLLAHALDAPAARRLGVALVAGEPAALAADPEGARVLTGPELEDGAGAVPERARALVRRGASATEDVDGVLLDVWVPVPHVVVVGEGVLGAALLAQAAVLGWSAATVTTVAQAEAAVAALAAPDVLVLLDHDPAFDDALLACARGPAFAGALGSRHTQAARRERLTATGATADDLAGVHGPVGLDLGARTPAETAVSVVAEVLSLRSGRTPAALAEHTGRIGA